MLFLLEMAQQLSPLAASSHRLQLEICPAWVCPVAVGLGTVLVVVVGVVGVVLELLPTQYAYPGHRPLEQSDETAGFQA